MSQPDSSSWFSDGWRVAGTIGMGFVLIIWWIWNQMVTRLVTFGTRLDVLEKTTVTHEELKEQFAQLREERRATEERSDAKNVENRGTLRRIEDKLDASQPGVVASELDRAKRDIQELRDWKHSVDPFIERRIDP